MLLNGTRNSTCLLLCVVKLRVTNDRQSIDQKYNNQIDCFLMRTAFCNDQSLWAKRPMMCASLRDHGEGISAASFAANTHVKRLSFSNLSGCALVGLLQESATPTSKCCVLLCHGYASYKDGFQLPALAQSLAAAGYNSFRWDFSGNGESQGTFQFANYAGEVDEIHAAKQFLEHHHSQQVVALLGHSKGGCDVILYAAKYGDIPLVINVAGRFDMRQGITERFGQDVLDRVKAESFTAVAQRDDQYSIKFLLTQQDLEERFAIDMAEACAAIKHCKVLTIHGTADRVIPVEDGRKFAAQINGSSYVEVAGADHNFRAGPVVVQQLVEAVIGFLQSNMPATSAAI